MAKMGSSLATVPGPRVLRSVGKAGALLALSPGQRYAALRQVVTTGLKEILYSPEFVSRTDGYALGWMVSQYDQLRVDDPLNRMMATDLVTYMSEDLLVKVDRTSMAHALECRSPLLDIDLVEWVLSLPSSYKLSPGRHKGLLHRTGKHLLREAVRDRFPPGFLDRPKQGFNVPLEYWFRGELGAIVTDRVLHGPLRGLSLFRQAGLKQVVDEHFAGRANHAATVWALLVLATWMERNIP
jgi:asparagine synthase (glutamine-hydrolysing)